MGGMAANDWNYRILKSAHVFVTNQESLEPIT